MAVPLTAPAYRSHRRLLALATISGAMVRLRFARVGASMALLGAAATLVGAPAGLAAGPKGSPPGQGAAAHGQPNKPPGSTHGVQTAEGVVQSVTATAVALRQLDGSTVSVPIGRHTVVFVNARHTRLAAVKPGFVLAASWVAGKAAAVLRFQRPG